MSQVVHAITPGDHYSPSTGSAVSTVVHGLSEFRPEGAPRPAVAVARGTYADRYDSAEFREYDEVPWHERSRYVDAALGRIGLPRWAARRRWAAMLADQRSWPPSVIVGHNAVQLLPSVDTGRHRAVLYAHNDLLGSYSRREAGRTLSPAAAIIAVSEYIANRLSDSLPAELRSRVAVVRNGVDTTVFRPRRRAEEAPLRVVFVGRVIPAKGPDVLIDAVARLSRDDVELTVVGSSGFDAGAALSPYERELRAAAADSRARIRFERFRPRGEIAGILAAADVAVVPSRWPDPCPLTVLEGMASGAAVVASDIGGIPETVAGAGILVPPDDPDALAQVIEGFAVDRQGLRGVQEACLARADLRDWAVASREFYAAIAGAR